MKVLGFALSALTESLIGKSRVVSEKAATPLPAATFLQLLSNVIKDEQKKAPETGAFSSSTG